MAPQFLQRFRNSFSYLWLIAVAGYLSVSAGQAMIRNYQSQQQIANQQKQLASLQLEKQRLEALLVYYKTDSYKEIELRQNFLLVMPGERVYALPESGNVRSLEDEALTGDVADTTVRKPQSDEPDWRQWFNYLI